MIFRLDDRLFFANSRYFRSRVHDAVRGATDLVTTLIFDAESVSDLDTAGAQALTDVVAELKGGGIRFVLARSRATFEAQLSRTGLADVIPPEDRFPTVRCRSLLGHRHRPRPRPPVEPRDLRAQRRALTWNRRAVPAESSSAEEAPTWNWVVD